MSNNGNGRGSPSSVHSIKNASAISQRTPHGATAAVSEQYEFNPDTDTIDSGAPSFPTVTTSYPPNFQPNMYALHGNNLHQPFNNPMLGQQSMQPAYHNQQAPQFNHFNQRPPHINYTQQPNQRQRSYMPSMARKIRELGREETITSFESWKGQLIYNLNLDPNFAPFLVAGFTWEKKSRANPLRGLTSNQAVVNLDLLLTQIANYCPVISRSVIIKSSTSLDSVWQAIRTHYGFQSSGSNFLNLCDLRLESDERPEDLFQKIQSFFEYNLLSASGNITHHGERITEDEELSPTLENVIGFMWLQLIHKDLPGLVKTKYGPDI